MKTITPNVEDTECESTEAEFIKGLLPIRDTLYVLSGKWKLPILISMMYGKKRFKEIQRNIPGLNQRMLSKELKEMEANDLITRTVDSTNSTTIEYHLTEYSESLKNVINELYLWGLQHRKRIMNK